MIKNKLILGLILLAISSQTSLAAAPRVAVLSQDFVIPAEASQPIILSSTPALIKSAEAGQFATFKKTSNPFSGGKLALASSLLGLAASAFIYKFVTTEKRLLEEE